MHNILTSISLEKTIQSSLQLDGEKSRRKGGRQKLTIDAVRQHIESFGYRLMSTQYVSVSTKLDISCPVGHLYPVSYNSFQRGSRCPECWWKSKKHTIDAVRQNIESFGYKLISTQYFDTKQKLDIVCSAGHSYKASFHVFQQGHRCPECSSSAKFTIDAVKQYIESFEGYRLRSTVYVDCRAKLDVICPVGHSYKAAYAKFQEGQRCPECAGNKKNTIDAVKQHIESFGYRLRSNTYVGSNAKLEIICPVGHNYKVTYGSFQSGVRCAECSFISKRRTMLNGEDWKPYGRNSKADAAWRKAVLKRDARTCQACFYPSKKLHAHHIESFARNPELQTDISNGVTLCVNCHYALHSRYGQTTATRADLAEFTRLKCR